MGDGDHIADPGKREGGGPRPTTNEDHAIVQAINRIFRETIATETNEDLSLVCLDVLEDLTGSQIGLLGQLGRRGMMEEIAINNRGRKSDARIVLGDQNRLTAELMKHDVYKVVLVDGRALLINDPDPRDNPLGIPAGHITLTSFLGVPLKDGDQIIGIIGLGNKDGGYRYSDQAVVEAIAPAITQALRRRKVEEGLKASEAKYRGVFEVMREGVVIEIPVRDEDGTIIDWTFEDANPTFLQLIGKSDVNEIRGKKGSDVLGPENAAFYMQFLENAVRNPSFNQVQYRSPISGREFQANSVVDGDRIIISFTDISELKAAHRQAEEERSLLQSIVDNIPVAIGVTNDKGGMVMDNGVLKEIWRTDLDLSEVSDYTACRAFWPDSGEPVRPEDWPAAQALKGKRATATFNIIRYDGSSGTIVINATPLFDNCGKVTGTVWINQDITDLRKAQDDLKRSNAELQQFAYVASHDLQEPLRMVTSYLGLLERKNEEALDPASKRYLRFAVDGALRMKAMINDLLAYSRVESRGQEFAPVDMNVVMSTVMRDLALGIEECGADVAIDPLPTIMADQGQMVLLMENLVSNAIKYRGEAAPQIHIWAECDEQECTFHVRDNGIGIGPQYHDQLFQMFQRLHTHDEYPGTGMGLALSRRIVERHNGRIWFDSQPAEGTVFHFSIPNDELPCR